ncbi:glycosyltransferase [Alishewanella sp. 16-MA]|uniref:Glycosyltransferase n=1 Tax=Alishewanella maricola TaxID=2795740 RepID=A0ABS8C3B4_9ALTE|nr:glycosyltransferase family protein [Alishewanella maricola]MCB5226806.1 glycosyltransferase [Alishewanella maricola]
MKILYGVQATGNGHITRARALLPALQQQGIEVDFLFSGRSEAQLFDMAMFKDYAWANGFTFSSRNGRVQPLSTLRQLKPLQFIKDVRQLDVSAYDLVLTDFEPVSAWAAKRQGILSVGLARQYALRHPLAGKQSVSWLKAAVSVFAPAQHYLGVHWQPDYPDLLPPLLSAPAVFNQPANFASFEPFILVYLPFEQLTQVLAWLKQYPVWQFKLYTDIKAPYQDENVKLLPFSRQAFPLDLHHASGVICNSGFGLCSEALRAGKKLLIKPLKGQIEQAYNAYTLANMAKASVFSDFTANVLVTWLQQEAAQPYAFPDPLPAVAQWLKQGCVRPVSDVVRQAWQQNE